MKKKKIAVIGVGGRTGTMFAFELSQAVDVLGVAMEREVELIKTGKLFVERKKEKPQAFKLNVIKNTEFNEKLSPDIIFLATKNPVSSPIKYYFEECRPKIPTLLISQNGIAALSEAKRALREVLGDRVKEAKLVRVILFNPIDKRERDGKIYIKYSLPIRIAVAEAFGEGGIKDIVEVFQRAGFEVEEFPLKEARNLEFSKLFLNLIGMASASRGVSVREGFENKEIFKEEVEAIKEYIKTVKLAGGRFLNFSHYPVGFFAFFFCVLPLDFLIPFRKLIAKIVSRGREGKPKDLDEINYYNGAVITLGKKIGIETPVNEEIYNRVWKKLKRE